MAGLRVMDGRGVVGPADPWETAEAHKAAAAYDGPVYVRISRMPVPELARERTRFAIGQGETLREGGDIAIVANGTLVHRALAAADALAAEGRSEERRVGKECVRKCRSRWSPYNSKKKNMKYNSKRKDR